MDFKSTRFSIAASFLLLSIIGASYAEHCPRANTIGPGTNAYDFYAASDGLFVPWFSQMTNGKKFHSIKFDRVEFRLLGGSYVFSGCLYNADGETLKMYPSDYHVAAFLNIPDDSVNFKKSGDLAVCETNELACKFIYGSS